MLMLICLMLLVMMIVFLILIRNRESFLFAGLLLGLATLLCAYVMIWTKYGGVRESAAFMLYLTPDVGKAIQYLPMSAAEVSRMLVLGKSIFLACLMLLTLYLRQPTQPRGLTAGTVLIVLSAVLHDLLLEPEIYDNYCRTPFFQAHQATLFNLIRAVYLLCIIVCLALQADQYRRIRIAWAKSSFYQIILLNAYLSFLFVLFAVFAPIQVSHFTGISYIYANNLYVQGRFTWILLMGVSVTLILSGSACLWHYLKIAKSISQPDVSIEQKMKNSNASVRMLIHGMKNQLLVQRAILRDIEETGQLAGEDLTRIRLVASNNAYMLERIDKLYRVFRSKTITLIEVDEPMSIVQSALNGLRQTNIPIQAKCIQSRSILADPAYLSEAIANVIQNGIEAIQAKPQIVGEDKVGVVIYQDRGDLVFEISDTGEGMSRSEVRRIYDPFYSNRNSNTNWGMGLTYTQEIVKAHFGKTSILSVLGQGTNVYISIPIYEKTSQTGQEGTMNGTRYKRSGRRG